MLETLDCLFCERRYALDKKTYRALAKNLPFITQFGLSLVAPPVLCMLGAGWLQRRFGLGNWVLPVAVLLAVFGSVSAFRDFFRYMLRQAEEEEREYKEGKS